MVIIMTMTKTTTINMVITSKMLTVKIMMIMRNVKHKNHYKRLKTLLTFRIGGAHVLYSSR